MSKENSTSWHRLHQVRPQCTATQEMKPKMNYSSISGSTLVIEIHGPETNFLEKLATSSQLGMLFLIQVQNSGSTFTIIVCNYVQNDSEKQLIHLEAVHRVVKEAFQLRGMWV